MSDLPPAPVPEAWQEAPLEWAPAPPPEARKARGTLGWDIFLGLVLSILALVMISNLAAYLMAPGWGPIEIDPTTLPEWTTWFNLAFLLVLFGVLPTLWVAGTRVDPVVGTVRYLGLDRPWPGVLHGLGAAVLLVGAVLLLGFLLDALELDLIGDPETDARFHGMNWTLAIATALIAGFAEEIFFRGVLQKWLGVWGQAVLFGLFHIVAGPIAVLVTALIGLLFGYLVKRGHSLWLVITAHFAYNLMLLGGYLLFG